MHVFCSYSCAVNRKIVPKATTCVFLGYAQSGYRCYDVKSKRLDVSLMLSLMEMESPHIFLNLINQPRGRMMMEMYCGLLLFINSHLILLQLMLRIHSSGQQLCSASSADCQPVLLTSEDSSHPAQHLSSRRRNHYVAQARTTDEDQQSGPVASLPVASSDSGSLSLVRRSSRPFPLQLVFRKSFSQESLPHLSSIFSFT